MLQEAVSSHRCCPRRWPVCLTLDGEHLAGHMRAARCRADAAHSSYRTYFCDHVAADTLRTAYAAHGLIRAHRPADDKQEGQTARVGLYEGLIELSAASAALLGATVGLMVSLIYELVRLPFAKLVPLSSQLRALHGEMMDNVRKLAHIDAMLAARKTPPPAAPSAVSLDKDPQFHAELGLLSATGRLKLRERQLVARALMAAITALDAAGRASLRTLLIAPQNDQLDGTVLRLLQGLEGDGLIWRARVTLAQTFSSLIGERMWHRAWATLVGLDDAALLEFAALKEAVDAQLQAFVERPEASGIHRPYLQSMIYRAIASQLADGYTMLERFELRQTLQATLAAHGYTTYWLRM